MYAEIARNRMLLLMLALIASASMSFNIKQLFDVNYYKNIASEAQSIITNLTTIKIVNSNVVKTKTVNPAELQCMAENIYFEAGNQSLAGKVAVGHVVLNRMRQSNYPNTACGVISQKIGDTCMFSWRCESNKSVVDNSLWKQSKQVAFDLLSRDRKDLIDITEGATHFHNSQVNPRWKLRRVAKIDDHMFYK